MSHLAYWMGYAFWVTMGIALAWFGGLTVGGLTTFVLGIYWVWNGVTAWAGRNPTYFLPFPRAHERTYGKILVVLGILWLLLSVSPPSREFWPVALVTAPALAALFFADRYYKRNPIDPTNQDEKE